MTGPIFDEKDGCRISFRVIPRAKRVELQGKNEQGELRVRLTAPPVENAANAQLFEYLSKLLGVPKSRLSMLRGEKSRHKELFVQGVSAHEAAQRLAIES